MWLAVQCGQSNAGIFFFASQSADHACERQSAQSRDTRPSWAFMHPVVIAAMPEFLRQPHANARDDVRVFPLPLLDIFPYCLPRQTLPQQYFSLYRCQQTLCRRRFVTSCHDEGYRPWPAPKCLCPTVNFARARNNRAATIL